MSKTISKIIKIKEKKRRSEIKTEKRKRITNYHQMCAFNPFYVPAWWMWA